ncbi:collagen alpha-1(I) chain-like [Lathamus discolor]|uniref:collagen alpha-1(I) chain-like n=1 Tax=Lathamus discolor TaxID=678569 RepID=UPI0032B7766E
MGAAAPGPALKRATRCARGCPDGTGTGGSPRGRAAGSRDGARERPGLAGAAEGGGGARYRAPPGPSGAGRGGAEPPPPTHKHPPPQAAGGTRGLRSRSRFLSRGVSRGPRPPGGAAAQSQPERTGPDRDPAGTQPGPDRDPAAPRAAPGPGVAAAGDWARSSPIPTPHPGERSIGSADGSVEPGGGSRGRAGRDRSRSCGPAVPGARGTGQDGGTGGTSYPWGSGGRGVAHGVPVGLTPNSPAHGSKESRHCPFPVSPTRGSGMLLAVPPPSRDPTPAVRMLREPHRAPYPVRSEKKGDPPPPPAVGGAGGGVGPPLLPQVFL